MRKRPPGQIARAQSGRALTPPVLGRTLGLHLRLLTHPALPTDPDRSRPIDPDPRPGPFHPDRSDPSRRVTPVTADADAPDLSYLPMGGEEEGFASFTPGSGP
ncbi:hypothetical protein Saso_40580 [Streptomyces asoensis]|uniref:Uncharacterized protein n=1 Tax=Streptomyces asoensis TaxID=249586 RepID=A0ABQ3S2S1_9ACTN|nr:hypothetical protein GCM10010496_63000 [Streptomyces asoensis]GHI62408.1 hypothetical protein Saso_40580 [Streptomyces asoensis]